MRDLAIHVHVHANHRTSLFLSVMPVVDVCVLDELVPVVVLAVEDEHEAKEEGDDEVGAEGHQRRQGLRRRRRGGHRPLRGWLFRKLPCTAPVANLVWFQIDNCQGRLL